MSKPLAVYDGHTRKRLAYLQNAYKISYKKNTDTLWTAEFSLPYSDPKVKHCASFNYVEIWDEDAGGKDRYVGLFRIMPRKEEALGIDANIVFQLEHVLSTLLDDVMLGYHEVGNLGIYTKASIGYILENQSEKRWVLGECSYAHQFLYGWQDENLLSALYSIVQPFEETDYYWDFDTRGYPWQLSLKRTNKSPVTDIRYKKNLNGITRSVDPSNLTTRLYCYGYGDGDNKLGISEVNGGIPYLESPNTAKYGVITQIWTDERFTIAESLKTVGRAMLNRLEEPAVSYDLDIQTINNAVNLNIGDTVRVVSVGLDELMTVKTISKSDVTGAPNTGKIELGYGTIDISNSFAELADRQRIAETYSQGSESIFTDSFVDNADKINPAEVIFTIPENAVHVNEIRFSCKLTNFRAYSKAVKGGGAGDKTTNNGGSNMVTSRSGGSNNLTSSNGGGGQRTSQDGGNNTVASWDGGGGVGTSDAVTLPSQNIYNDDWGGANAANHNHGLDRFAFGMDQWGYPRGMIAFVDSNNQIIGRQSWIPSGAHQHGAHNHNVSIPSHSHLVNTPGHSHNFEIPNHSHSVAVPTHDHGIDIPQHNHTFALPNHTHDVEYGIYKGPSADELDIYLDDTLIGHYKSGVDEINLIDYMSKNANGNVLRGKHRIRIVPYDKTNPVSNPNAMTRVECTFQIRLFTNARGGKQY